MSPTALFAAGALCGAAAAAIAGWRLFHERQARDARFLTFALHELNTPITAVNMTLLNLLSEAFGQIPAEQLRWLEMTRDQVQRLNAITGDFRDLVQLAFQDRVRSKISSVQVSEIVTIAVPPLKAAFEHAQIDFALENAQLSATVLCDRDRAQRALMGLLYHARKFRVSGAVRLSLRLESRFAVLCVEYGGAKLTAAEVLARLELYFPARITRDQVLTCAGLGLGLMRAALRQEGGDLTFNVDASGQSRLRMMLPLAEGG